MEQVILDSDIFSELLERKNIIVATRAEEYFKQFGNFTISAMTFFEVQKGLIHKPKPRITTALIGLMRDLVVLPIQKEEAKLGCTIHGVLKKGGHSIGEGDPIIAATAVIYGLTLITNNAKHFQFVIDAGFPLKIENWRDP